MFLDDTYKPENFVHKNVWGYNDDGVKPKYMQIGLNIRRKEEVRGFEFRIMDHLPESELENLAKIIYLCACMSYETENNHINHAGTSKGWHNMMAQSLFNGSRAKVDKDYIKFLEQQFNIKLGGKYSNIVELLRSLVDELWSVTSKNKKNGLWLILGDDKSKPEIHSKNKEILDTLLN
jgi:hypothetical protein